VLASDCSLGVEARETLASCGLRKPFESRLDHPLIPQAAILLFEQQQSAIVLARLQARGMQMHESE
jgi:hypothetical protein